MDKNRDEVLCDHTDSTAAQPTGPGIMLLTDSMQLLYKDRRAWDLCQQIIQCQDGKAANGVLPPAVASLVDQIRKILTFRTDQKDWEQIPLRRTVHTPHSSVLLCGMALVDQTMAENRIIIVMHETGIVEWQDKIILQARERFQLTARETTVVQHLLKGWTKIGKLLKKCDWPGFPVLRKDRQSSLFSLGGLVLAGVGGWAGLSGA